MQTKKISFAVQRAMITIVILFFVTVVHSQIAYDFKTCGATGTAGPNQSQVNSAYTSSALAGNVTVIGSGIQEWVVPVTGNYSLTAAGASGGYTPNAIGGRGRVITTTVTLTAGTVLRILVGQEGGRGYFSNGCSGPGYAGGGGGGSFIINNTVNSPLLIAGGGGGAGQATDNGSWGWGNANLPGVDASPYNVMSGQNGTGFSASWSSNGIGGTNGGGGTTGSGGAGGGGYLANGASGSYSGNPGISYTQGGSGGTNRDACNNGFSVNIQGGFGGGAGAGICYCYEANGGGGGGYSGGGGSNTRAGAGGGGGNFVSGTYVSSGLNTGNGYVTITLLVTPATALNFGGDESNSVTLGSASSATNFVTSSNFTIEARVKMTSTAGYHTLIANRPSGSSNNGYALFIFNGQLYFEATASGGMSSGTIPTGTWTHIAMTFSNGTARFYINGIHSGTSSGINIGYASSASVRLGNLTNGWAGFNGSMDEVRIWTKSLCPGEIINNMNCELNTPQTGLLAYYKLNNGFVNENNAGLTTAADASGNGYNGTLNNFALTGSTENWVAGNVTGSCSPFSLPNAVITAAGSTTLCSGNAVVLNATPGSGLAYQWFRNGVGIGGATGASYTANAAGAYTVTITKDGCSSTSAATTVVINPVPVVTLSASATSVCSPGTVTLSASGADSYQWSNGASGAAITVGAGTYSVTGTTLGCTSSSQSITIAQGTAPSISNCPQTHYQQIYTDAGTCTKVFTYSPTITGTNANISYTFSGATTGSGTGTGSGSAFNVGQTTVTITASNACGTATCSFVLTVIDNIAPVALTKSITVYLDASGTASIAPQDIDNGSNDNCGPVTLSFNSGTICGIAAENQSTTLTAPAGELITSIEFASYGTPNGTCNNFSIGWCHATNSISKVSPFLVGMNSGTVPATNSLFGDPCGGTVKRLYIQAHYGAASSNTYNFTCDDLGNNTVKLLVTDANGNVSFANATVTVIDNIDPVLTPASSQDVNIISASCAVIVPDVRGTATDNCSVTVTQSPSAGSAVNASHNQAINVTVTATDASGNTVVETVVLTAKDVTAPVASIASLPTITAECSASASVPTATDNCGGLINGVASGPTSFNTQGTHVITWTYTDAAGNSSSQQQTVVVDDNTPPVIACPFDIEVNATPGTCGAVVNYNQPSATDNCGSGILPTSIPGYTYKGTLNGHTYFVSNTQTTPEAAHAAAIALGGHLATISNAQENAFVSSMHNDRMWIGYTDRDNEGTYRWVTNEPVTYTNWSSQEPNNCCGGQGEDWAVINWVGPSWNDWLYYQPAYYVVEFEGGNIPTTLTAGLTSGSVFPVGTTTVTWSATDAGGNTVSCSFKVTVRDTEKPKLISVPSNTTVECDAVPNATVVTASDNCPGVGAVQYSELKTNGSCAGKYTLTRTWSVTDAHNNTTTASQIITVVDTQAPVVTMPANATVNCDADKTVEALGSATATDACSGATVSYEDTDTQSTDINNAQHYNYVITRRWKAVDGCGNVVTMNQIITVQDKTAPAAICQNVTITLAGGQASITAGMIDGGSTDNCSPVTLSVDRTDFDCGDIGTHTVTLTVTDVSGNSSTCTASVEVVGVVPTCTIASVPSDNTFTGGVSTNLYLGYGPQSTTLDVTPTGGSSFTYSWNGPAGLDSYTAENPVFTPTAAGTYTFTVTVTNNYGCTTTCNITICVMDIRVANSKGVYDGKKVYVCHVPPGNPGNANTLEISVNAVPSHIGPSGHATDRLGKCTHTPCTGTPISKVAVTNEVKETAGLTVKLSPNPTTNYFALQVISSDKKTPVTVRIMDGLGKVIETRRGTADEMYRFGNNYINGTYFVEVMQGQNRKVVQGVKVN